MSLGGIGWWVGESTNFGGGEGVGRESTNFGGGERWKGGPGVPPGGVRGGAR